MSRRSHVDRNLDRVFTRERHPLEVFAIPQHTKALQSAEGGRTLIGLFNYYNSIQIGG